jgi:single-stranded DNA-specific DHH superfamily exonuclease
MQRILNKLDYIFEEDERIDESGVRNITKLVKNLKKAVIFFHKDLDGVTSAIGIKSYLEQNYRIKIIDAQPINYGAEEYSVDKPPKGTMLVMVDFAHNKPQVNI